MNQEVRAPKLVIAHLHGGDCSFSQRAIAVNTQCADTNAWDALVPERHLAELLDHTEADLLYKEDWDGSAFGDRVCGIVWSPCPGRIYGNAYTPAVPEFWFHLEASDLNPPTWHSRGAESAMEGRGPMQIDQLEAILAEEHHEHLVRVRPDRRNEALALLVAGYNQYLDGSR